VSLHIFSPQFAKVISYVEPVPDHLTLGTEVAKTFVRWWSRVETWCEQPDLRVRPERAVAWMLTAMQKGATGNGCHSLI
jgi:hypothetical protein